MQEPWYDKTKTLPVCNLVKGETLEESNFDEFEQIQRCLIEQLARGWEEKAAAPKVNTVRTDEGLLLIKQLLPKVDGDSLEKILEMAVQSFMQMCYLLLAMFIFNIVTGIDFRWVAILVSSILTFLYNKQDILDKLNLVINYQFSIYGLFSELAKLWSYRFIFFDYLRHIFGVKRTIFSRKGYKRLPQVSQGRGNWLITQDPGIGVWIGTFSDPSTEQGVKPRGVELQGPCKIENQSVITSEMSAVMAEDFFNEVLRPDPIGL